MQLSLSLLQIGLIMITTFVVFQNTNYGSFMLIFFMFFLTGICGIFFGTLHFFSTIFTVDLFRFLHLSHCKNWSRQRHVWNGFLPGIVHDNSGDLVSRSQANVSPKSIKNSTPNFANRSTSINFVSRMGFVVSIGVFWIFNTFHLDSNFCSNFGNSFITQELILLYS